jgi:hypothetical protein
VTRWRIDKPTPSDVIIPAGGTLYFLGKMAFDWFGRHNVAGVLEDLIGAIFGSLCIWYGSYVWKSFVRAFRGKDSR